MVSVLLVLVAPLLETPHPVLKVIGESLYCLHLVRLASLPDSLLDDPKKKTLQPQAYEDLYLML